MSAVFLDRSRIKSRQECPTYRYLHYHKRIEDNPEVIGLQRPLPATHYGVGLIVHKGLEILLLTGDIKKAMGSDVDALLYEYFPNNTHLRDEMTYLCKGLIYGWWKERYEAICRDYDILDVEKTFQWPIHSDGRHEYLYNFRIDALLKRKDDGRIAILDFKTSKKCDDEWMRMFEHDLQPILYTKAIDELLGVDCIGMIFEGLVKGHQRIDTAKSSKFHGKFVQYSPLCYGYKSQDGFHISYIKGTEKFFVGEYFSVEDWYDKFVSQQLDEPLFVHVPPIKSPPVIAQNIVNSIIYAEHNFQRILDDITQLSQTYPNLVPHCESTRIEKHTNHCFRYGSEYQCPFYDMCWTQGVSDAPLEHGYIPRVQNHSEEVLE